ncbi:MAG TPA: hypothetical protein VJZ76_09290 [Thermoanaerobaculia bacterium]|nr:hypothetical protein [Thermoanaerobaculia bacterium]
MQAMSDDLPPQFQEQKRPEAQLFEELPIELPPPEDVPNEPPPRSPEPFLRQG